MGKDEFTKKRKPSGGLPARMLAEESDLILFFTENGLNAFEIGEESGIESDFISI